LKKEKLKKVVLSAMFLSIGLVLPFFTGQIKQVGNMLLPMHIPVFLCGLICGWQYGLLVGIVMPIVRSFAFGMPHMYPNAIAMAFELAGYGFFSGFLYSHSKYKCIKALYKCILAAMVGGRLIWGVAEVILLGLGGSVFTFGMFMSGAILKSVPGIILQLVIIPVIMVSLKKAKMVPIVKKSLKH